jgi:ribonuclease HII
MCVCMCVPNAGRGPFAGPVVAAACILPKKYKNKTGRGPLAGPVVAAACILPKDADEALLAGINDSKDVLEHEVPKP